MLALKIITTIMLSLSIIRQIFWAISTFIYAEEGDGTGIIATLAIIPVTQILAIVTIWLL